MTGDNDRALDDWRFHCPSPVSTRCRSRLRWALSLRNRVSVRSALVRPWAKRFVAAFCSASRRLARFRAVRRLTTSPIRSLGGIRITWLGPSWPASAATYTPVPSHWITTTESLRSLNAGGGVAAKAYPFYPAAKSHFSAIFIRTGVRPILHEYSVWPDDLR
jgi:hypothetical protein